MCVPSVFSCQNDTPEIPDQNRSLSMQRSTRILTTLADKAHKETLAQAQLQVSDMQHQEFERKQPVGLCALGEVPASTCFSQRETSEMQQQPVSHHPFFHNIRQFLWNTTDTQTSRTDSPNLQQRPYTATSRNRLAQGHGPAAVAMPATSRGVEILLHRNRPYTSSLRKDMVRVTHPAGACSGKECGEIVHTVFKTMSLLVSEVQCGQTSDTPPGRLELPTLRLTASQMSQTLPGSQMRSCICNPCLSEKIFRNLAELSWETVSIVATSHIL